MVAGLILAIGLLTSMPDVRKDLARALRVLGSFQTLVDAITITLEIWGTIVLIPIFLSVNISRFSRSSKT